MLKKLFSGRDSLSCQAVDVNLDAFLAKSLTLPITPDSTLTNSVLDPTDGEGVEELQLVKRLQLGLDLALHDRRSPATAQIQYSSSRTGNVIFVIKAGRVYGGLTEGGLAYSLEPCIGQVGHPGKGEQDLGTSSFSPMDEPCHLWVKALKKEQLV